MSLSIDSLPLDEAALRALVAQLGCVPADGGLPFWDEAGAWSFQPERGWPKRWYREPRIADWRERCDPRYEGLEDEQLAREELAAGRLPGHLVDDDEALDELWKDGGGNSYFRLRGARTSEGSEPIFFFDHDDPRRISVRARSFAELFARELVRERNVDRDPGVKPLLEAPIVLDPQSLHQAGRSLAAGWRAALGMPTTTEDPACRREPDRTPRVTGSRLRGEKQLLVFNEAYVARFINAGSVDADAFADLAHPLTWWRGEPFQDLAYALRNIMARMLAVAGQLASAPAESERDQRRNRAVTEPILTACTFLQGLTQGGEVVVKGTDDPMHLLDRACAEVFERRTGARFSPWGSTTDDGRTVLDEVPQMRDFHEGWRGIVPDAVLDQSDVVALGAFLQMRSAHGMFGNIVYNLLRRCGDELVDPITDVLPSLLPCDQVMVLHGLDAFPRHAGVLALYDRVLGDPSFEATHASAARYRDRVARGQRTTGWES